MTDLKISQLAAVTDVQDTDELVLARVGATKKITGQNLKAASAIAQSYIGYNTIGGSWEAMTNERVLAKQVVFSTDGLLASVDAYIRNNGTQVGSIGFAVFEDSGGVPTKLIHSEVQPADSIFPSNVGSGAGPGRWYSHAVGKWMTAGTYWIAVAAFDSSQSLEIAYDAGSADRYWAETGFWFTDGDFQSLTNPSRNYSMRASFVSLGTGPSSVVGWVPIQHVALSAAGTFDFQGIPSTFKHLKLIVNARGSGSGAGAYWGVRFNNDSGANYDWILHYAASGVGLNSEEPGSANEIRILSLPDTADTANRPGSIEVTIPDYAGTTFHKTLLARSLNARGGQIVANGMGDWASTAAIDRVQVFPTAGSTFVAGSTCTLMGYVSTPVIINETDPVLAALGTPDTSFEFNGTSLAGLTLVGTPDVEDAHTSVPGAYFVQDDDNAYVGRYVAATPPFTVVTKMLDKLMVATDGYKAGLFISDAAPGMSSDTNVILQGNANQQIWVEVAGTSNITNTPYNGMPVWFAIRVNSSTDVDFLFSPNGRVWYKIVDSRNPGFTVATCGLTIIGAGTGMAAAFDYLRIWNSAKAFPGAAA